MVTNPHTMEIIQDKEGTGALLIGKLGMLQGTLETERRQGLTLTKAHSYI